MPLILRAIGVIPNEKELLQIKQIVNDLESFGHRGSATDQERLAAEYIADKLQSLGITAELENFRGHNSYGLRILVHLVAGLVALILFFWWPLFSITLSLLTLISWGLEMSSFAYPFSNLFMGRPSRNVVGKVAAAKRRRRRIVLVAHLDTQRTGWIWGTGRIRAFLTTLGFAPGPLKAPLFLITMVLMSQIALGLLAGLTESGGSVNLWGILFALVYLAAIGLVSQWAFGSFVPGANDNASGVAGLVVLANRWTHFRHDGTELVVLVSGCEESGLSGAAAWARRHRQELAEVPTVFLNLDTIGCQQLHFLMNECALHGLFLEYPEVLLELCQSVAMEMGLEFTQPHPIPTHTDGLALLVRGLPGVTITSCGEDSLIPNYHLMSDRAANLDFHAVYRASEFAWRVLMELEDYGLAEDVPSGETLPDEPSYSPIAMMDSP